MTNFSRINEIWAPGPRPNGREFASILIGEDNVKILYDAGMEIDSHFWKLTRDAVAKKLVDDRVE